MDQQQTQITVVQNENEQLEEQVAPIASTTDTLLPNKGPSSSTKKCSFGYVCGLCSYILLGLFLFTLCLAAILGGGRFGALPVISRTGAVICLGISIGTALILLVQCTVLWIYISREAD